MMKDGVNVTRGNGGERQILAKNWQNIICAVLRAGQHKDTEQVLKEKLWILETNGKKKRSLSSVFFTAWKSGCVGRRRYIAILDSGIENKVLYVYDTQEGMLRNLGEEGLGRLDVLCMGSEQPVIYAMTGEDSLQLKKYDVTQLERCGGRGRTAGRGQQDRTGGR